MIPLLFHCSLARFHCDFITVLFFLWLEMIPLLLHFFVARNDIITLLLWFDLWEKFSQKGKCRALFKHSKYENFILIAAFITALCIIPWMLSFYFPVWCDLATDTSDKHQVVLTGQFLVDSLAFWCFRVKLCWISKHDSWSTRLHMWIEISAESHQGRRLGLLWLLWGGLRCIQHCRLGFLGAFQSLPVHLLNGLVICPYALRGTTWVWPKKQQTQNTHTSGARLNDQATRSTQNWCQKH